MTAATTDRSTLVRGVRLGIIGGMAGAMVMAVYAMVASVVDEHGFLTPLYHIAAALIDGQAMADSMAAGMQGDDLTFRAGPAAVGLLVHVLTGAMAGAMAGAVFGAAAVAVRLGRGAVVLTGGVFGLVVLLLNGFVGLPVTAELFGGGDAIRDMPDLVGWGTFVVEHVLYGVVLGAVMALAASRTRGGAPHAVGVPA